MIALESLISLNFDTHDDDAIILSAAKIYENYYHQLNALMC